MEQAETVTIPKGTLFKIEGIPFRTIEDVVVAGTMQNLELALRERQKHQWTGSAVPVETTGA